MLKEANSVLRYLKCCFDGCLDLLIMKQILQQYVENQLLSGL